MKRIAFCFFVLVAAATVSNTLAMAEMRLGGVADLNLATLSTGNEAYAGVFNTRACFGAGVLAEYRFGKRLSLAAAPMFLRKGADVLRVEGSGNYQMTITGKVTLSYVEVPVSVKLDLGGKRLQPYVLAGPTFGFKTGAQLSTQTDSMGLTSQEEEDLSDQTRSPDVGVGLGGGVALPIKKARVFLEGQYVFGLRRIDTGEGMDFEARNRGFQVRMGVTLPLGSEK